MRVVKRISSKKTISSEAYSLLAMLALMIVAIPAATLAQIKATTNHSTVAKGSSTPPAENGPVSDTGAEIMRLENKMAEQQRQIDELRLLIEEQNKLLAGRSVVANTGSIPEPVKSVPGNAPPNTEASKAEMPAGEGPAVSIAQSSADQQKGPLSFRIGSAYITPVGFLDFTTVFRSTNAGTGIGTSFGSIPFNNTTAGKLTELRFSAQNSRIGFRVDAKVKGANVLGYFESDFNGAVPGNVEVSSNSDPNRLRVYWVDVRKGKLELMGGQSWSMLTPNRKGLSPLPSDIFYTQNIDINYQAGLVWSRDAQFRLVYHPSDTVALGVSLENPEQYIGGSAGGGLVTLPATLATAYATQLNNGNTGLATPNLHPDIIAKVAFDPKVANRSVHIEAAGLFRTFKLFNPLSQRYFSASGGGGSVNLNLEVVKNLRLVSNNYYSAGGGRWIFGQAPDLIVRGDGSSSVVNSGSTVTGFEAQATKDSLLYGYYGGVYVRRNVAIDPADGKFIGYGYPGSPSGQNRVIHEITAGVTHTFWRDPEYGALQLMGQYSYVSRHPWSVAAGQPSGAHTNMVFLNLRYLLPGSAPTSK